MKEYKMQLNQMSELQKIIEIYIDGIRAIVTVYRNNKQISQMKNKNILHIITLVRCKISL